MHDLIKTLSFTQCAAELLNLHLNKEGYQLCPFCQEKKFKVTNDQSFKCFKPSCKANAGGDLINLLILTGKADTPKDAINLLRNNTSSANHQAWYQRIHTLTLAFNAYRAALTDDQYSDRVLEFLNKRGYGLVLEQVEIGYAPPGAYLVNQGIPHNKLIQAGLLRHTPQEFFQDRVIFPIRDNRGNLVHLQGRALDPNEELRWLATPSGNVNKIESPPITHYLFNQENLTLPAKTVFLTEGISDGLSLLELGGGIQVVSCFGLEPKLLRHIETWRQVNNLIAIFDSDVFPTGHSNQGEYKSWHRIIHHLIKLQIEVPTLQVWCLLPPATPGIKDINDWLCTGLTGLTLSQYIKTNVLRIEQFAWNLFKDNWEQQLTLARLINVHRHPQDLANLRQSIQALESDSLEYLIKIASLD